MRLVVRCQDGRPARAAQAALAQAGVEAAALAGPYRPAPDGEDIAIIVAAEDDAGAAEKLAGETMAGERAPLACLAAYAGGTPLAGKSVFLAALALEAQPKLLAAQVEAGVRVALAEDERKRRAATAAALGLTAPAAPAPRKLRALYIGAPSPVFLSLERALAARGGLVAAAFSSFSGFDHLHDEVFDAVVLNGAQNPQTAISLCAALRRNAALYHLPTLVATAPGDAATAHAAIERGAAAIVEANAACEAPLAWLFDAIRRDRRRRRAETDLAALRDVMGDLRTGLFGEAAFRAHLARLAEDHHASGRALALAALRVMPAHGARQPSAAAWNKGFTEIANLAGRLMRETDCGAALAGDVIAVAMPATDLAGAKRTAERIAAVAECTAFASGEGEGGPLVFEQSTAELQAGESGAGLLARAGGALDFAA